MPVTNRTSLVCGRLLKEDPTTRFHQNGKRSYERSYSISHTVGLPEGRWRAASGENFEAFEEASQKFVFRYFNPLKRFRLDFFFFCARESILVYFCVCVVSFYFLRFSPKSDFVWTSSSFVEKAFFVNVGCLEASKLESFEDRLKGFEADFEAFESSDGAFEAFECFEGGLTGFEESFEAFEGLEKTSKPLETLKGASKASRL